MGGNAYKSGAGGAEHLSDIAKRSPNDERLKRLSHAQMIVEGLSSLEDLAEFGRANRNPDDIGFLALVAEDYRTHGMAPFSQGFWALFWHRFGNWRMSVRPKILRIPLTVLYRLGRQFSEWLGGIMLPYTVVVGRRVRIEHFGGMILIARAIGDDVIIRQNTTFGIARTDRLGEWPVIGDEVDIGAGAAILGAVKIGRGAKIGANAVVLKDIPSGAIAVGVPARIVKPQ